MPCKGGGATALIPLNIWQTNPSQQDRRRSSSIRASMRFKNGEIAYGFQITPAELHHVYTPDGVNVLASGDTKKVPANTVMDVNRYK